MNNESLNDKLERIKEMTPTELLEFVKELATEVAKDKLKD